MTKIEIRAAIERVLRQVQATSGRECPDIADTTKPIGDLDAFDSLMAVEATVLLSQELKVRLAKTTPFVSATGRKRALTVAEIVDCIGEMVVPAGNA